MRYNTYMKQVLGAIRRADDQFNMITAGDKIAVGLSGGKDSVLLLYALNKYKSFKRVPFDLIALTVDLGLGFNTEPLEELCHQLQVPFYKIETDIGKIIFETRKEKNPCALCAKMRKGAFYKKCMELGVNKSAYAHHRDDLIDTFLLSLLYEGRLYALPSSSYLSRSDITLIRPLIFLEEKKIISVVNSLNLPVVKNPCPVSGMTKREEIKQLSEKLTEDYPEFRERVMSAISNVNNYNLWGSL